MLKWMMMQFSCSSPIDQLGTYTKLNALSSTLEEKIGTYLFDKPLIKKEFRD